MLLLYDDDILPETPEKAELEFAETLGHDFAKVDERLLQFSSEQFLKVARVIHDAIKDGGFELWDDGVIDLHARRVIALIEAGKLEVAGNPRRPRFSEVRLPATSLG